MAYNPFRDGKQTQSTQTGRVNPFRQTSADRSDRERVMRNWQSDAEQHGILNNPQYTDEGKAYQQMAQEYAKYGTQYQNQLKQGMTGRQWAADTARRLEELTQQQRAAQQTERRRQDADAIGDPGLWVTTTEQYDALPEARRQEEARRAKQRPAVSLADYDKRIAELRKEKEWADYFAEAGLRDEQGYTRGVISGRTAYDGTADKRRRIAELENRLVTLNQNTGWASTVEQSDEIERERNAIQQELESLGAGYKNAQQADYTMSWRNGVRDNWTDEERSNFYYLYNDNKDEAQAYARRINDRYAYSDAQAKKEKVGEWASQNFWTGLAGTAASVGLTMTSLADTLDRTKEYAATGDVSAKSGLTPADIGMAMTSAIASSLNEKSGTINDNVWVIGGKGLGDLYETGVSILNSLASVYMLGGVGTYANFFGQASKTAYEEGIQRGLSVDKALTYGYASGVAEVAGEMFSIEHLIKMKNPSSLKGIIKNIFVQGGIEASEESATTLMNTISDAIINGDKSELASNYYALIQAGYSPADAEKLVIADWTQGVMYDALGGFVSGVASAGVHSTVQGSMTYKGDAQELIDYAKSEGADTAAAKRAKKYEDRVKSGKRMTNYQAGTLTELAQEAVVSKDLDNIREAVGKRLAALGENSSALTEAVVRQAVQQEAKATDISVPKVTEKQRGLIQNSKAAKRVLSEMDIGNMRMETAAELSGHDGSQYQRSNEWARDIGTRIIAPSEYGVRSTNTVTAEEKRADVKVGDESGKVVGFKNGMARVEVTENGKSTIREVKPDDVQQLPKQTRRLFDEISRYDGDTQAAMYAAYMPGQDIEAYVQAADTAMNLYGAQTKATLEQARSFGKATFRMLSDAQLDALMQAGRKLADQRKAAAERTGESKGEVKQGKVSYDGGEADGRKLKAPSKEAIDRMSDAEKTLAEALTATGVNVVFYESEANAEGRYSGAQGMYYNGTVYLDVNAGMNSVESGQRTIVLTAAHEMTHFIRENSEAGYIALREFITDRLMQQGLDIEELVTQKRARESRELSYDEAVEEVIADACETVLTEPTAIRQLASDNMPLAKKIRKWLNDFFRKIKSAFAGLEAVHDEAKAMTEYMDELRAMWDDALAEAVRNRANKNAAENGDGAARYSLRSVDPVRPTSNEWHRSKTTAEAKRIFPDMWNVAAEKSEKRNPTQIASTVGTYRNIFNILKGQGFDGTILDASSGLGIGTETGRGEFGFKVEDIEPFPGEGYTPMYRDYSALDKQYDAIISSAVLNVLPQDQRDALVTKMGQLLKPGGKMYITTRGKDVDTLAKSGKNIRLGDMEWIETVKGSYQKGFTNPELVAYLKDALGDGFDVVPASKATGGRFNNNTSVVVTKRENSTKYSIREDAPAEIHKAVTDKNYGGNIWLTDTTPSIMLGRRGVNNLPMLMKASHIRENILTKQEAATLGIDTSERIHYHGLGEELFKKVIDGLDDITVAYRGTPRASDPSRRENSFLLLSSVKDGSGNTIVVPVYINEMGNYNRVFMQTNKIASVYGRSAVSEYIKREVAKGNLVRIKKRSPVNSESPAPTAVDYNDVTSQAKAANKSAMAFGNNSIRSTSENSNTKIKKSERDAEYLSAVKRGDLETARSMVNEAAEDAEYDITAYHVSMNGAFNVFDRNRLGENTVDYADDAATAATAYLGFWFSDHDVSKQTYSYGMIPGDARQFRLKAEALYPIALQTLQDELLNEYISEDAIEQYSAGEYSAIREAAEEYAAELQRMGYSGLKVQDSELGGTSYVVFDPEQIKSADAVVYDDNGKVIPLSERFNAKKNDIRYSAREITQERGKRRAEIYSELQRLKDERSRLLEQDADYAAAQEKRRYATTFRERVDATHALNAAKAKIDTAELDERIQALQDERSAIDEAERAEYNAEKEKYSGAKTRGYAELPDTRTAELDEKYNDAVKRGNKKETQALVLEAAERAMPASVVRDEGGKLLPVYHWTNASFNSFDRSYARTGNEMDGFFFAPDAESTREYGDNAVRAYLNITNPAYDPYLDRTHEDSGTLLRERLAYEGYDGVIRTENGKIVEYMAFDPEQIKSAEPVVYDDNGKVIPLSERFNSKSRDIRYSNRDVDLSAKYPQLNLNEDISELDGVPAIELTDGSVLPITERDGRYPTHVSFIEANRIDVDDLKSGGWIGNGVYDPSFTSDTQRYIERQQARKRVAELTGKQYEQFRYSMRDVTAGDTREELAQRRAAYARLERENAALKARVDYLKGQTKLTKEATVRESDVAKYARSILKEYMSRADSAEIQQQLQELGNYIVQNDARVLSYDEIHSRAEDIAETVLDNAHAVIAEEMPGLGEYKEFLRNTALKVSDNTLNDLPEGFRKEYSGKIKLRADGRSVDSVWMELQERYGEGEFPSNIYAQSDMLEIMADKFSTWQAIEGNPFYNYMGEAIQSLTNDIMDMVLGADIRQTAPTYADRAAAKLARERAKGAEAVAAERERGSARAERLQAMLESERERRREEVAREKADKWAAVGSVREYYQSMIKRQRAERAESANRGKYRAQVEKRTKELSDWLLTNSDKQHVPEVLKKIIGDFLATLDFTSRRALEGGTATQKDARFQQRLSALQELLRKQAAALEENSDADTFTGYLDIDGDTMDALSQLVQDVNAAIGSDRTWTVNRMNAADLARLDQVLKVLQHSVKNMNKLLANAHFKSSIEAAQNTMTRMDALKTNRKYAGKVKDFFAWDNVTPVYAFRRFGDGGKAIFDSFTRGWDKMAFNMRTIYDYAENAYTADEVRAWEKDIREVELSTGKKVRIPVSAIMELYVSAKQEQAMNHLNGGGLRVSDFKDGRATVNQTEHYLMTAEDIAAITGELSDRQRAVADALQRFAAGTGAAWGNEVSMKRFGYRAFTEENYWPIATDDNTRDAIDPQARANDMYRLLNMSMTKGRNAKANNALVVGSIFDTFSAHMADMAKYNALALPVLDAMKWYNYREKETLSTGQIKTASVQGAIEGAYGRGANNYIVTLMKDINGKQELGRGEDLPRKMISNYKVASVAANVRVALLQPTSYVRAGMELDPKYLAKGALIKGGVQEMMKYSGTAIWKDFGGYDTNISRNIRDQIKHDATVGEQIKEKSMVLAELGDRLTWGALWNACKLEVQDKQHLSGEELMQATANRFREVIYLTQVMDSTLTRSHNMRSKSTYASLATAFMSEPTLSYSMVQDAFMDYMDDRKISKNGTAAWQKTRGKLVKALGIYAMSAAASAIIESLWDAFRDDDDYETLLEKILEAMFGTKEGWFLDGNLIGDLRITTKLPLVKDIVSMFDGYSNDRMDTAWAANLVKAYKIWKETIDLATGKLDKPTDATYNGKMTWYGKLYNTLKPLSQMTGFAIANLTRDVSAIWNTTFGAWTGKKLRTYYPGVKTSVKYAYQDGYLTAEEAEKILINEGVAEDENDVYFMLDEWDSGKSSYSKYGAIKDAAKAGDKAAYKSALKDLTDHGITEKNAQSAIRSALKEWYQGTEDTPQSVSKQDTIKKLQEFAGMSKADAEAAVLEWTCKIVTGVEYSDIKTAYLDGDVNAVKAKQMLMRYGGLTSEEADKRVQNYKFEEQYGFTYSRSNVQDEYIRGSISEATAKTMLTQYGGKTDEEAERSIQAFNFLRSYPEYDAEDITEAQIAKYYESVDGSGVSVREYVNYASFIRSTSADVDADGNAINGSKMRKVMEYIDSLNLTSQQKDVLFLTQYAKSSLRKTPWH